jgi:hypothetical protein
VVIVEVKDDDMTTKSRHPSHLGDRLSWIFQIEKDTLSPAYIERRLFEDQAVGVLTTARTSYRFFGSIEFGVGRRRED